MITIVEAYPVSTQTEMVEYVAGVLRRYRQDFEAGLAAGEEPDEMVYCILADLAARLGLDECQTAGVLGPVGACCLGADVAVTPLGEAYLTAIAALETVAEMNGEIYRIYDGLSDRQKATVAANFDPLVAGDPRDYGYQFWGEGDVYACRKRLALIGGNGRASTDALRGALAGAIAPEALA